MAQLRQMISLDAARPPFFAGVDLGGTSIKLGVVDDEGATLAREAIPTEVGRGPQAAIARVAETMTRMFGTAGIDRSQIARLGLGTPGTMDTAKGMLLSPGNLPGWWNFPIRDALAAASGFDVTYSNDAGAAAYGEFWVGSGQVLSSMVLFTLGTGVGGGIIIGDLSITGENSAGSELGHLIIDYHDSARLCSCGQHGHLEAYASASSVVKRTLEVLESGCPSTLADRMHAGEALTALAIDEEAERGDELALEIVLDTARYLGIGIVSAMHAIDPQGVVIGGAMNFGGHETATGRKFLERVKQEVAQRAFPFLIGKTTIDYASLGGEAGLVGAAGLARRDHRQQHAK